MAEADVMPYDAAADDHWYEYEDEEEDENSTPDSVLLSLVQAYDWAGTLARIASHPDGTFFFFCLYCVEFC